VLKPGKRRDVERLIWLRDYLHVVTVGERVDLVIIEGYSFGSRASHAHSLGELGGVVRVMLHERGIPFAVVSPSALKLYACGKGNATKDAVLASAVHRFGREMGNDEADALWLWALAKDAYGEPLLAMPAHNREALEKIDWPKVGVPA
jgi:crossover junction endodeoxyribonuclease RuvC